MTASPTLTRLPDVLDDLTRREFIAGLIAAGLLSACGGGNGTTGDGSVTTRPVDNEFGTTDVPVNPERIAVLDVRAVDHLVALGITPSAIFVQPGEHMTATLDGAEVVQDDAGEVNIELLARSRPDLIIAWGAFIEGKLEQIRTVAPTVGIHHESFTEWKEPFRFTASVVGQTERAAEIIAGYDSRVEDLRSRLREAGLIDLQVCVVRGFSDIVRIASADGSFPAGVLDAIGLQRTAVQKQRTDFGEINLSMENISEADADIIFLMRPRTSEAGWDEFDAILDQVQAGPLWQNLRAARQGRVYEVTIDAWLQGGPVAANIILDEIESALLLSR